MALPSAPLPALVVREVGAAGPADLDVAGTHPAEVAARVAVARLGGAVTVRTDAPAAARRAAHVIDALVAARAAAPAR